MRPPSRGLDLLAPRGKGPAALSAVAEAIEADPDARRGARGGREGRPLPQRYWSWFRLWFALGVPAFVSLVIVFWLMIAKPA